MNTNDLDKLAENIYEAFIPFFQALERIVNDLRNLFSTEEWQTIIKYSELYNEKIELQNRIDEIDRELEFLLK
jgi:hypothetical protein